VYYLKGDAGKLDKGKGKVRLYGAAFAHTAFSGAVGIGPPFRAAAGHARAHGL